MPVQWINGIGRAGYFPELPASYHSGLLVCGSGEISAYVMRSIDPLIAREIEDLTELELWVDLPVDSSDRSSRLQERLLHVPGSKGSEPASELEPVRVLARFAAQT